jgi:ADP-ribose pyrophosphatase
MKKIPDNATKVFEGIIFDVYHWEQELFDGTFTTFEALKKRDTVGVIAVTNNLIIINNEEQPGREAFLSVPSGMSEKEGSLLENAKRELVEETGYTSDDWQQWFISEPIEHVKIDWDNYFHIAKNCKKTSEQKLDPGENIEVRLVTFDEFLELRNNPEFRTKDLIPTLKKAAENEEEKQKLKDLLGISP